MTSSCIGNKLKLVELIHSTEILKLLCIESSAQAAPHSGQLLTLESLYAPEDEMSDIVVAGLKLTLLRNYFTTAWSTIE